MSEHSKGPWTAEEPFQRDGRWASNVRVGAYDGESGPGNTICIVCLGGPGATCGDPAAIKANARLIAASPELVKVCQKVRARAEQAARALPGMTLERLLRAGDGVEIRLPVSIVAECIAALKKAGVKP